MKMSCLKSHREAISLLIYHKVNGMRCMFIMSFMALILIPLLSFVRATSEEMVGDAYINIFVGRIECQITFFVVWISWFLYFIFDLLKERWKYKTNERMMILPCKRVDVILSHFLVVFGTFVCIYLVQAIVFIACYFIYLNQVPDSAVHNGLFLSILQSSYTKFFLPLDGIDILRLYLFTIWISLVIVYYGYFSKYMRKGLLIHLTTLGFATVTSIILLTLFVQISSFSNVQSFMYMIFFGKTFSIYLFVSILLICLTIYRLLKKQYV